jgi:hypothetical protein
MAAKKTTQFNQLVERLQPLADWMEKFKPTCKTISVSHEDMKLITKYPDAAKDMGFHQHGGLVTWRQGKFEIKVAP